MSEEVEASADLTPGPTFVDSVTDPAAFAGLVSRLARLSRYVDQSAFAVLEGRSDPRTLESLLDASLKVYETLTEGILQLIVSPPVKKDAEAVFAALESVSDLMSAALIIDQAHSWTLSLMNFDATNLQIMMAAAHVAEEMASSGVPVDDTGHGTYV